MNKVSLATRGLFFGEFCETRGISRTISDISRNGKTGRFLRRASADVFRKTNIYLLCAARS